MTGNAAVENFITFFPRIAQLIRITFTDIFSNLLENSKKSKNIADTKNMILARKLKFSSLVEQ